MQRSAAHAAGRPHRQHEAGRRRNQGNRFGQGKNAPLIAMAHEIPYVATATVADLHDLEAKVERAMSLHGPRYLHVLVPVPARLGLARSATPILVARLAQETGLFPVFEAEHGEVTAVVADPPPGSGRRSTSAPRRRLRITSSANAAATDIIAALQAIADRNIRRYRPRRERTRHPMEKPFAITLDVGTSLAQQDRQLAHRASCLRRPHCRRATAPVLPARTSRRWLYEAEEGAMATRRAWRRIMEDNPFPAVMGRVCYHPCETACNRGHARRGGRHQRGRALPRRPGDRARLAASEAEAPGLRAARPRRRRRPVRPFAPPTSSHGSRP